MSKKIYDIFPPKSSKPEESDSLKIERERDDRVKHSRLKEMVAAAVIFIFAVSAILYFKLPRLNLEIWPKIENLTLDKKITIDKNVQQIDLQNKLIPGVVIEDEKELWQEFPATGTTAKEGKAGGTIRVYNKYNPPTPINLKATTRFLSDSGKYFRAVTAINIPAAGLKGGNITSSFVDVKVEAIEAGAEYNIDSAKFSIPGLVGTPYYYSIYGESTSPMAGGFKTGLKQVTQKDIQEAENITTNKILDEIESSLRSKVSSGFILLENAFSKEIIESSSLVKVGATVEKFNFQAKAKARALVFKKSDLESFARQSILANLINLKMIIEDSLETNYTPDVVDLSGGKIILNFGFSAKIYSFIDKDSLSVLLGGKSAGEVRETVYNNFPQEVSSVEVNFWPSWVKKSPKDTKRIFIKFNLE